LLEGANDKKGTAMDEQREKEMATIKKELKELLIERLSLEGVTPPDIEDDAPLFGGGLGLDSLDAVEIIVILQRNFKIDVKNIEKGNQMFRSVSLLAEYVYDNRPK